MDGDYGEMGWYMSTMVKLVAIMKFDMLMGFNTMVRPRNHTKPKYFNTKPEKAKGPRASVIEGSGFGP